MIQIRESYYRKLSRPIRTLLIGLLFRLLRVDMRLKDLVLTDDIKILEGTLPMDRTVPEMTARYKYALATVFVCPNYREYLYYQLVTIEREHIKTIDPNKRDIQQASSLFILRHLQEMKEAYNTLHRRGQLPEKKRKDVLRSFHTQSQR